MRATHQQDQISKLWKGEGQLRQRGIDRVEFLKFVSGSGSLVRRLSEKK